MNIYRVEIREESKASRAGYESKRLFYQAKSVLALINKLSDKDIESIHFIGELEN